MNTQRLQQLADFLKTVPTEKFNLTEWRQSTTGRSSDCNTQACAIGWACLMPEFQKEGLKFHYKDYPLFKGIPGWIAVETFFEISYPQAQFLFGPVFYPMSGNPKYVIDRINHVIRHGFPKQAFNYMGQEYHEL